MWNRTYRSENGGRPVSIIFLHNWWFGWPSSKSVVSIVDVCEAQEPTWLSIQRIKVTNKCVRRMAHDEVNKDWLDVSLKIDHSSISLTRFVHLMGICIYEYLKELLRKIDVEIDKKMREMKKEERTDEPQRCITHNVVDLLFFIFIFFCSFPHFSFPGLLSLSVFLSSYVSRFIKQKERIFFFLLLSTMLMIVGG